MKSKLLKVLAVTLIAGAAFGSITSLKNFNVDQQAAEPHPWGNDALIQIAAEPHPWGNDDLAEPHPWASDSVTQFAAEPHPWSIEKEDGLVPTTELG